MKNDAAEIPLAVVGCDFRTASSRWRSQLVLEESEALQISSELNRSQAANGFVDLNTCNRNEWIVSSENPRWAADLLLTQMKKRIGKEAQTWITPYVFTGSDAVQHILRVAIGQESLVVGERQIAGQLFKALETARNRGTSSRILNGLGPTSGRLVRLALRRGTIIRDGQGVHSLAVSYVQERLKGDRSIRVAIVGIGAIGKRVLGLLENNPRMVPICCNRTVDDDQRDRIRPLSKLPESLNEAQAVIICTGAHSPVIRQEHFQEHNEKQPLLIVDIGIPEQVHREGVPDHIEVVGLDELSLFCNGSNADKYRSAVMGIDDLVQKSVAEFQVFCREPVYSEILDTIQKHHKQLIWEEIPRLVSTRLNYIPENARNRFESDLRSIILEYTNEVFRTIRDTSRP